MISLLLALLLLATPAAAHHEETTGGGSGKAPGSGSANHCITDGTTREGWVCDDTDPDCDGTCTAGWCSTAGDSKPCAADSDCDGVCYAVSWGREYGHTGTCTSSRCVGGAADCSSNSDCDDPLNIADDFMSQDPGFIHHSTNASRGHTHCYSDTPGRMSITDDKLQYCDADGVKRTVLHGYQSSATGVDTREVTTNTAKVGITTDQVSHIAAGQMGHFGFSGTQSGGLTRYTPFDTGWVNFGTLPTNLHQVMQPVMVGSGATGIEIEEICCHAFNVPASSSTSTIYLYSGACGGTLTADVWFWYHEGNVTNNTLCRDSSNANSWATPQIPDGDCAAWRVLTNASGTSAEKKMEDLSCTFRYSVY